MQRDFIAGRNFSGRSEVLLARLRQSAPAFFLGPYAEAALSGLSSTVADEYTLYSTAPAPIRPPFPCFDVAAARMRKPQSLSGGEQVLLALHCFSASRFDTIGIDTGLEQLDAENRASALSYLGAGPFNVLLIDNRTVPAGWSRTDCTGEASAFAIDWGALGAAILPQRAPAIAIDNLRFAYRAGKTIFAGTSLILEPGTAHRLSGANGAGKTTLLKILVGALVPTDGVITLGGERYEPWREGNRALALATQNPDQQWCGATLREDVTRRRRAGGAARSIDDDRLSALARALGVATLDQHLYELPLAARKRVSWLWPLSGAHPWIMLDEPTIGQDRDTREQLARLVAALCAQGYGVIFVTHDDEFAAMLPHRRLHIQNRAISTL